MQPITKSISPFPKFCYSIRTFPSTFPSLTNSFCLSLHRKGTDVSRRSIRVAGNFPWSDDVRFKVAKPLHCDVTKAISMRDFDCFDVEGGHFELKIHHLLVIVDTCFFNSRIFHNSENRLQKTACRELSPLKRSSGTKFRLKQTNRQTNKRLFY